MFIWNKSCKLWASRFRSELIFLSKLFWHFLDHGLYHNFVISESLVMAGLWGVFSCKGSTMRSSFDIFDKYCWYPSDTRHRLQMLGDQFCIQRIFCTLWVLMMYRIKHYQFPKHRKIFLKFILVKCYNINFVMFPNFNLVIYFNFNLSYTYFD